jgi:hypothetical protein
MARPSAAHGTVLRRGLPQGFLLEKNAKGRQPLVCPFGEGSVQRSFLTNLTTTNFAGLLSQHHEYKTLGTGKEMIANIKKDLAKLREWIA